MKKESNVMYVLRLALTLLVICAVVALALAGTNAITKDRIAAVKAAKTEKAIQNVLPGCSGVEEIAFTDASGTVAKVYRANTMDAFGFAVSATYEATIGTSWTEGEGYFTQTIDVVGMKTTDNPIMDLITNTSNYRYSIEQEDYSKIFKIVSGFNKITVYASEKTENTLNVQLKVVR